MPLKSRFQLWPGRKKEPIDRGAYVIQALLHEQLGRLASRQIIPGIHVASLPLSLKPVVEMAEAQTVASCLSSVVKRQCANDMAIRTTSR
jgi:hypothetical protein